MFTTFPSSQVQLLLHLASILLLLERNDGLLSIQVPSFRNHDYKSYHHSKIMNRHGVRIRILVHYLPSTSSSPRCLSAHQNDPWERDEPWFESKAHPTEEPDLFEYFDPLVSPHFYSQGIDHQKKIVKGEKSEYFSKKTKLSFNTDVSSARLHEFETINLDRISLPAKDEDLFDPTLSPHAYPKGVDSGPIVEFGNEYLIDDSFLSSSDDLESRNRNKYQDTNHKNTMIGILLIDHGSRRSASNQHLESIAQVYQKRLPKNYIVKAAHMEIAAPSIYDGLRDLATSPGISTILCHPFFLSPGRHVTEDIPQLIQEAQERLRLEENLDGTPLLKQPLDVRITDAVGSNVDGMIEIMDLMIQQEILRFTSPS